MERYLTNNHQIELDSRINISCNGETKDRFRAACEYLNMDAPTTLHHLMSNFVADVVEHAWEYCRVENELAFQDAYKLLDLGQK